MIRHVPNTITLFRIALIPLFLLFFYADFKYANWVSLCIFVIAAISDGVDGYVARRWHVTSDLGRFLDPVADKLIVTAVAIAIASEFPHWGYVVAAFVLIGRDMIVSALREWASLKQISESLHVSIWGKLKTLIQFIAFSFLILREPVLGIDTQLIGNGLLLVAVGMALWSMWRYVLSILHALKVKDGH